MNDSRWGEILDKIEEGFTILDKGREDLEDMPNGFVEFIVFESPMGKIMLERTTKPKTVGEKSFGGSKYGAGSNVEKIYSEEETVKTLQAYKDVDGEWEAIDASAFV